MTPHTEVDRLIALSDMGQEAKPRTLREVEANALRKALEDEAYSQQVMAANAHDKIKGAL